MNKLKNFTKPLRWFSALLLIALAAGCNNSDSDPILGGSVGESAAIVVADTSAPTIIRVSVTDGTIGVMRLNQDITATFSEAMDPATLTEGTTFTVCSTTTEGGVCDVNGAVSGVVSYTNKTVAFNPDGDLVAGTWYKSTITEAATDLEGNALLVPAAVGNLPNPWSWQTGAADPDAPTITLTNPANGATDVPLNKTINATFSEEMRQATITDTNYTVMETVTEVNVPGTVSYDVQHNIASFVPSSNLSLNTDYTVTVSNAVEDLAGKRLQTGDKQNPWTFETGETVVDPQALAINLGAAKSFGIASRAGLTTTDVTVVNGDIALYPEASCTDATGNAGASQTCLVKTYVSPTGMTVNGSIYWAGDPYDDGATALAVTNDLNAAWVEGKNKADTFATGSLGGELGAPVSVSAPNGKTLVPGVYHEDALGLAAGNVVTFDAKGDPSAIFIIKIDSSFVDSGTKNNKTQVKLANGAQARNIWFIAGLDITIGQGTIWYGNVLAGRTATINSGSALSGRVLAGASGAGAITLTGAASSVTSISVPQ
jgi:hypothetical protein